jgi:hypothetical protein
VSEFDEILKELQQLKNESSQLINQISTQKQNNQLSSDNSLDLYFEDPEKKILEEVKLIKSLLEKMLKLQDFQIKLDKVVINYLNNEKNLFQQEEKFESLLESKLEKLFESRFAKLENEIFILSKGIKEVIKLLESKTLNSGNKANENNNEISEIKKGIEKIIEVNAQLLKYNKLMLELQKSLLNKEDKEVKELLLKLINQISLLYEELRKK